MLKRIAIPAPLARVQDILLILACSLLVGVSSQVAIPLPWTPVPVTLQPLAVMLTGAFLGSWRGAAAMFLYLMEGVAGLPVFTPVGPPGLARLAGPTGGYLMSYPLAAFTIGWMAEKGWTARFGRASLAFFATSVIILLFGAAWMVVALGRSWSQAAMLGIVPFIPGDILKILFAASLTSLIGKRHG